MNQNKGKFKPALCSYSVGLLGVGRGGRGWNFPLWPLLQGVGLVGWVGLLHFVHFIYFKNQPWGKHLNHYLYGPLPKFWILQKQT